jgi:pantoate--beta-alanine ligase
MKIIHTISELNILLNEARDNHKTIGFVPTMGALHQGHTSLVERSLQENDFTIVSIFVNPTQFNNPKDLENYPRTLEDDCQLLKHIGTNIVFAPSVHEMYPEKDERIFSYPPIDTVMEGAKRPGHFNGVCQIVSKLFDIVKPDVAYFGEKDFQQIAVINAMVKDLNLKLQIKPCPIVREQTGLAMSSRNTLLTEEERITAANIYKQLSESVIYSKNHTIPETIDFVTNALNNIEILNVEYFQIVDAETLQEINNWNDAKHIVGCITVFCGSMPVRLIDNIRYK